jgi:coenzyme F420 hydrogenase subunit beta
VRTDLGREIIDRMIRTGAIIARPADSDEKAMKLLRTLSVVSRRRWPAFGHASVSVGVPPPKKKAESPAG